MYSLHLTPEQAERIGEVSHGTLRTRDLLQRFTIALTAVVNLLTTPETEGFVEIVVNRVQLANIKKFIDSTDPSDGYFEDNQEHQEEASQWIDLLYDYLNGFAPEGWYFGSHEGDGSCFGYWQSNEDDEEGA